MGQFLLKASWLGIPKALLPLQHQDQLRRQMLPFPPELTKQLVPLVTITGGGGFWRQSWQLPSGCCCAAAALGSRRCAGEEDGVSRKLLQ